MFTRKKKTRQYLTNALRLTPSPNTRGVLYKNIGITLLSQAGTMALLEIIAYELKIKLKAATEKNITASTEFQQLTKRTQESMKEMAMKLANEIKIQNETIKLLKSEFGEIYTQINSNNEANQQKINKELNIAKKALDSRLENNEAKIQSSLDKLVQIEPGSEASMQKLTVVASDLIKKQATVEQTIQVQFKEQLKELKNEVETQLKSLIGHTSAIERSVEIGSQEQKRSFYLLRTLHRRHDKLTKAFRTNIFELLESTENIRKEVNALPNITEGFEKLTMLITSENKKLTAGHQKVAEETNQALKVELTQKLQEAIDHTIGMQETTTESLRELKSAIQANLKISQGVLKQNEEMSIQVNSAEQQLLSRISEIKKRINTQKDVLENVRKDVDSSQLGSLIETIQRQHGVLLGETAEITRVTREQIEGLQKKISANEDAVMSKIEKQMQEAENISQYNVRKADERQTELLQLINTVSGDLGRDLERKITLFTPADTPAADILLKESLQTAVADVTRQLREFTQTMVPEVRSEIEKFILSNNQDLAQKIAANVQSIPDDASLRTAIQREITYSMETSEKMLESMNNLKAEIVTTAYRNSQEIISALKKKEEQVEEIKKSYNNIIQNQDQSIPLQNTMNVFVEEMRAEHSKTYEEMREQNKVWQQEVTQLSGNIQQELVIERQKLQAILENVEKVVNESVSTMQSLSGNYDTLDGEKQKELDTLHQIVQDLQGQLNQLAHSIHHQYGVMEAE